MPQAQSVQTLQRATALASGTSFHLTPANRKISDLLSIKSKVERTVSITVEKLKDIEPE